MKIKPGVRDLSFLPLVWFVVFLLLPLLIVIGISFLKRGAYGGIETEFTFENYIRAFDPLYLQIFVKSLSLAFTTASLCLLLGIPLALTMATATTRGRTLMLSLIAVPFLTNLVIRIYALKIFVGYDGPLLWILNSVGIIVDPFLISQNQTLVFIGLISTYLPFMVFPLYGALEKFDFTQVEAAFDLGARSSQALLKIILPQVKMAAISGFMLVFIPALGEFVIPDLLGGARTMLIGNLITEQFLKARDWPFGAALSMILILVLAFSIAISKLLSSRKATA